MTHTMPPNLPGSIRAVPHRPSEEQRERLRELLQQSEAWALRPDWVPYIVHGDKRALRPIDKLTPDQRIGALAWLRQQRHRLHAVLEGGQLAPDGWLESLPLTQALEQSLVRRRDRATHLGD